MNSGRRGRLPLTGISTGMVSVIAKLAGCALLLSLAVTTLSSGSSDAPGVSARDLVVKLLVFRKHAASDTYVYDGREGTLRDTTIDYWSTTRIFGGEERDAQPSHRFYRAGLDVLQCPEVVAIARQLQVEAEDIRSWGSRCNQQRGIITFSVYVEGTYPDYEEKVGGLRIRGTMKTPILNMIVIYNDSAGSWQFVDSLAVDPFAGSQAYFSLGRAIIDCAGANCYYKKRKDILRYNLRDNVIDTLTGCDQVGVPSNNMHLLKLSTDEGMLTLFDERGRKISSTHSNLKFITDVAAVSDDAYVVAGWRHGLLGIGREYGAQLVDFSADKTEELFDVNGGAEILSVKVQGR